MHDSSQYQKKLVAELNWKVSARLENLVEDMAHSKLAIQQNKKLIRRLRKHIKYLYIGVTTLLLCILFLALNA